ncbi:MAG: hybrid sensor histidine kinase/response regulator, partial [Verrucomicrobiales bacterium]|nr:hybrid sensor histidine kinase/response regulator [Verrucomicrobiales bacterium]
AIPFPGSGFESCFRNGLLNIPNLTERKESLFLELVQSGLVSCVAVPLVVEGKRFGILVGGRKTVNSFRDGEKDFMSTLSGHVGLAAHQAQLHTLLKAAYDELRQTQQAVMQQERLRALGKMASGIAHDINNALSPIVVYSELLLNQEGAFSESNKKYLQHIKTSGDDIAHIVSRMREFYRKREEEESLFAVDLNELTKQVLELTRPRWRDIPQEHGITVRIQTDFDPNLPKILGNESELREALTNLVINAVDALPQGGEIHLRTKASHWRHDKLDQNILSHVLLEVQDTGIGMDEDTRSRCFEPFFSTKGKRGTGLGLAMVYGVMQRHEAVVEVESVRGVGTTMRLFFPVKEAAARTKKEVEKERSLIPTQKILCIDDEPLLRELIKEILETEGHTVEVADGGSQGIEKFKKASETRFPFSLVITDLGMPYVDGRQVALAVKNISASTPVVMLTGWGTMMKSDGDLPEQVDAVISKPPRMTEIREVFARLAR